MSKRNSQANKAAARERLRAERERQAKKDKVRKQVVVGLSVVAVLAVAGGVGYGVMQLNKPSHWEAAKDAKNVTAPKNTSGTDGTTVVVGKSTAKKTLELYE
ncbi:DsbA family protein, partial [Streptomyces sp. NPDC059744]